MTREPEIRPFRTGEEYRQCVELQDVVWGPGFSERVPSAILMVSQRLGGIAAGAYDPSGALLGFVFGMTGLDADGPVHWSDMLAVRPGARNAGLGRRLKLYQRSDLLDRGVTRMLWTFDPLQSRNAHMNLARLGAVAREYQRDMYGQTDSPLHRGIGTDRLVALWLLDSARVERRLAGEPEPERPVLADAAVALGTVQTDGAGHPRPADAALDLDSRVVAIAIPAEVEAIQRDEPALGAEWRHATRAAMEAYVGRGYEAQELVRAGPVSHYLFVERIAHAP